MAQIRQGQQVGIQPAGGFAIPRFALDAQMESKAWQEIGALSSTVFDMVKKEHDEDAIRQAQADAPQMITRDGQGMLVPVSNFEQGVSIFDSKAYRDAYRNSALNTYTTSAESDFQNHAQQVMAQHPTDSVMAAKALEERRNAMVAGLDPRYAPIIAVRLQGISGQAVSRVAANAIAERNKVNEANFQLSHDSMVEHAATLATTPDKFDADALQATNAVLADRIRQTRELAVAAGYTPERIAQIMEAAKTKVEIARDSVYIRNLRAVTNDPNQPPGAAESLMLSTREYIQERGTELTKQGKDGKGYVAAMSAAFNEASGRNAIRAAANEAVANRRIEDKQLQLAPVQKMSPYQPDGSAGEQAKLLGIETERTAVMSDPSLTSGQKLKMMAVYDQAMNRSTVDLSNRAAAVVTQMATEMLHPDTTAARSKGLLQEMSTMAVDGDARYMSQGTRNQIGSIVSQAATNEARIDVATMMGHSKAGLVSPTDFASWGERNANRIGTAPNSIMSPEAWQAATLENRAAWLNQKNITAKRVLAADNAARGIPPTADQVSAMPGSPLAFGTRDGAPYDVRSEDHQVDASASLNKTMTVPKEVKESLSSISRGTDPESAVAGAKQAIAMKSVLMKSKGMSQEEAIGFLRSEDNGLGAKTMDYLSAVKQWGPELAGKMLYSDSNSQSRNLGKSEAAGASEAGKIVDDMMVRLQQKSLVPLESLNPISPSTGERQFTRDMLAGDMPSLINRIGLTPKYNQLTLAPDVKAVLEQGTFVQLSKDGAVIDKSHPDQDAGLIAAQTTLQSIRGDLELIADPSNPKVGVYQWKSANTHLGEMAKRGAPLSDREVRGYALGLLEADQMIRNKGEVMWPDYDRASVTMRKHRSSDGSFSWKITGQHMSGIGLVDLMTLSVDDPRVGAFGMDIYNQASKDMIGKRVGLGVMQPADDHAKGWWAGRVISGMFGDAERGNRVAEYLQNIGYDPSDRTTAGALFDFLVGNNPADPRNRPAANIDYARMREAITGVREKIAGPPAKPPQELPRLVQPPTSLKLPTRE